MSKVICEREQLVSIADAIRVQNGETSEMTLDEMSTAMDENNAEIEEISGLIEEISEILDGKVAGGGGSLEMSHVEVSINHDNMDVSYTTVDDDGNLTSVHEEVYDNYFEFDAVKGSMFSVWIPDVSVWIIDSSGCELLYEGTYNSTFGITDTESVVGIDFTMSSQGGSN